LPIFFLKGGGRGRPMSDHFGRVGINLVWRKGASPQGAVRTFANTIQTVLGPS
jgi:hypothetical protein